MSMWMRVEVTVLQKQRTNRKQSIQGLWVCPKPWSWNVTMIKAESACRTHLSKAFILVQNASSVVPAGFDNRSSSAAHGGPIKPSEHCRLVLTQNQYFEWKSLLFRSPEGFVAKWWRRYRTQSEYVQTAQKMLNEIHTANKGKWEMTKRKGCYQHNI